MVKRMFFGQISQTNWFPWQPNYEICQIQVWCWISLAKTHLHTKFEGSISNSSKVMDKRMFFGQILQTNWFPWQPKYEIYQIQV